MDIVDEANETVEDVAEEAVETVEEVKEEAQEAVEEAAEEVVAAPEEVFDVVKEPEVNPYPHISERKAGKIREQINAMIRAIGNCDGITLQHIAAFDNPKNYDIYKLIATSLGYKVSEMNEKNEVFMIRDSENNFEKLSDEILTLADTISAYNGNYRGWKVLAKK